MVRFLAILAEFRAIFFFLPFLDAGFFFETFFLTAILRAELARDLERRFLFVFFLAMNCSLPLQLAVRVGVPR